MNNFSISEFKTITDDLCISILLNMNDVYPHRNQNRILIKEAVKEAEQMLSKKAKDPNNLSKRLNKLIDTIEYEKIKHGIGLFVSESFEKVVYFNNQLVDKVTIGKSFDIRNMLFSALSEQSYYVVILNEKYVRLLKGVMDELEEIKTHQLPFEIKNEYQYPEIQNTLSRAPEETDINAKRLAASLREADEIIQKEIIEKDSIILISGLNKIISSFKDVTGILPTHVHYDEQSYENMSFSEIGKHTSKLVKKYHEQEALECLEKVFENQAKFKFVSGIEEVWYESIQGKGEILFVEENFLVKGYKDSMGELFLSDQLNMENNYIELPDVVDDIMKNVIFTGGKVIFLPEDSLNEYGRILLTLRY